MSHINKISTTLGRPSTGRVKYAKKNTAFQPIAPVLLATRDYGLVRVNNTASTPHPKKYHGLDIRALSARLQVQQGNEMNNETSNLKYFDSDYRGQPKKPHLTGHMSFGTPHPNKAVAMNPKVLRQRIDEISLNSSSSTDRENAQRLRSFRSIIAGRYPQKVTNIVNNKKKVTVVSPRIRHKSSDETSEFYQHRQTFCKAEFTIARYGKKMSEQIMAKQTKNVAIDTNLIIKDLEAAEQIELYIQELDFSNTSAGSKMKLINVNKKMLNSAKQDIAEWAKKRSTLLNTIPPKHTK